jgi:peroxiredoxin Q/BCP
VARRTSRRGLRSRSSIDVGDPAPSFSLAGTGDRTYALEDYLGSWVILAFYPGDFTPVCTRQFCSYRDGSERLDTLDATVLGISPQSVESHERFRREHELTIPLLADPERQTIKAYGVSGPGGHVKRSIFIIDPQGTVRHRDVALLGLRYRDVSALADALAAAR